MLEVKKPRDERISRREWSVTWDVLLARIVVPPNKLQLTHVRCLVPGSHLYW
jgi:hypothetical protein